MHSRKFAFLFLAFTSLIGWALPNNSVFESDKVLSPDNAKKLFFRIESTNFVKNNEYFNKYSDGYTLLGFMVRPKFVFFPSENTKLEAGVHILKYSGQNTQAQATPILSFSFGVTPELQMVLGTLNGALDHGMIEQMYRIENHFENNLENGVQFLYSSPRFRSDLWVNWEKFIFQGDPFKEEFTFGWVNQLNVSSPNSLFQVSAPLHFFGAHRGGQIDSSGENLETRGNMLTGLTVAMQPQEGLLKKAGLNAFYLVYNDLSPALSHPYRAGHAYYANAFAQLGDFQLDFGYWRAHQYLAPRGEAIFQSASQTSDFTNPEREMLVAKLGFTHNIYDDISFSARFEPYYDLRESKLDYSTAIYLVFNRSFFLKQL